MTAGISAEKLPGFGVSLSGGAPNPSEPFFLVGGDSFAMTITESQGVLRLGDPLSGRFPKPFYRLHQVPADPFAGLVAAGNRELSFGVSLFGGFQEPVCGTFLILSNAIPGKPAETEAVLGGSGVMNCGFPIPLYGFRHIPFGSDPLFVILGKAELHGRVTVLSRVPDQTEQKSGGFGIVSIQAKNFDKNKYCRIVILFRSPYELFEPEYEVH